MYKTILDNLYIALHGNTQKMDELIESIGLDPERFVIEGKEFICQKIIMERICPKCKVGLIGNGLSVEHVITMICPVCGEVFNYFGYGD